MTILYVIAHSIEPKQLAATQKRAMKILFTDGNFYVYLNNPCKWDNEVFTAHRMMEQLQLMKALLGNVCDASKLSVIKLIGKEERSTFVPNQAEEEDDDI